MTPDPLEITAILLAGGRSTRFGRDKGSAAWRGRALVQHVVSCLPVDRAGTLVVVRKVQESEYQEIAAGATLVADDPDLPDGPLRGVISGLKACATDWAWIVACDQPLVRPELLTRLVDAADDRPVIPVWDGRLQPLAALYPAAYANDLADFAAAGERSLIGALVRTGHLKFGEDACRAIDPDGRSFLNVNTPKQLEEIETLLKEDA